MIATLVGVLLGLSVVGWLGYQLVKSKWQAQMQPAQALPQTAAPATNPTATNRWANALPYLMVALGAVAPLALWWVLLPENSPLEYWRAALVLVLGVGALVLGFVKKWPRWALWAIGVAAIALLAIAFHTHGVFDALLAPSTPVSAPAVRTPAQPPTAPAKPFLNGVFTLTNVGLGIAGLGLVVLLVQWLWSKAKSGGNKFRTGVLIALVVGVALALIGGISGHNVAPGAVGNWVPAAPQLPQVSIGVRALGYTLLIVAVVCSLASWPTKGLKNSFIWTTAALVGVVLIVGATHTVNPILDGFNAVYEGRVNPNPKALWWLLVPGLAFSTYLGAKHKLGPLTGAVAALTVALVLFPAVFTAVTGLTVNVGPWLTDYGAWVLLGLFITYFLVAT